MKTKEKLKISCKEMFLKRVSQVQGELEPDSRKATIFVQSL